VPEWRKHPRILRSSPLAVVPAVAVVLSSLLASAGPAAAAASDTTTPVGPDISSRCPWLETAIDRGQTPSQLANTVLARMTVPEKIGEMALVSSGDHENLNAGVPRLCIPRLTLQDGPQGSAFGADHVTQLPAPLGVAATFDTSIARTYGGVQGSEAAGQGIDVVQGPNLNIDRVPQSGRTYEGFGEDPVLVSAMGVADIQGIQQTGAMAMAKHFAVYNQETDRGELNDAVAQRALEELYLPPFRAAVTDAHVSSVMCAYPRLNGTFQCQDGSLLGMLRQWGFAGFVRSDLGSVHDPLAAIAAGTDLIKPAQVKRLAPLVGQPGLPLSAVDEAVTRVLTTMFAHGLVGRPNVGSPESVVDTPAHTAFALTTAERSAVLLKDQGGILPLTGSRAKSVAVIGADASSAPVTTGYGSSKVLAPFTSTPLAAISRRAGPATTVTYADGGSTTKPLPAIPSDVLTPASGVGHGLTLTLAQTGPGTGGGPVQSVQPTVDVSIRAHTAISQPLPGLTRSPTVERRRQPVSVGKLAPLGVPPSPTTRSPVVLPAGWSDVTASWTGTLTPPRSGLYTLSLEGDGRAELTLDGKPAVSDTLSHAHGRWSQSVPLVAGHPYQVGLDWEPVDTTTPSGESLVVPSALTLGWQYVSDQIAAAAAAARAATVAVVFAGDYSAEAFDRPTLSLPGDENALIAAVAAANPRTVVVLNTGGPVLMPWLGQVAGVIEDWYPGEQAGAAIAALLFGDVDPGGRLPVTFPTSDARAAVSTASQWPGIGLTADYTEGLDVGYRYDHATGTQPLFPFGYGLTYTRFTLGHLGLRRTRSGYALSVRVSNRGGAAGTDVPQAYLTYPAAAGEPPGQLVAFTPITLAAGESRTVSLSVPSSAFEAYLNGAWSTTPGTYTLSVGESSADLPLSVPVAAP
jgi:beta-glucosidase